MDVELFQDLAAALSNPGAPGDYAHEEPESLFLEFLNIVSAKVLVRPSLRSVAIYCTGFVPGEFKLVRETSKSSARTSLPLSISTTDRQDPIIRKLFTKNPDLNLFRSSRELFDIDADGGAITFWLWGRGEYYGFMRCFAGVALSRAELDYLRENLPIIGGMIADENFAYRLKFLIDAIPRSDELEHSPDAFITEIAGRTARAFGADNSILRMLEDGELTVKSHFGQVDAEILQPRALGALMSGRVVEAPGSAWAAASMRFPERDIGAVLLTDEDRRYFLSRGVESVVCCKLVSDARSAAGDGTLAYMFNRPHIFSRRDINLFTSYCGRLSDSLQLVNALAESAASAAMLEAQARRMTYVEIANILSHDLWHKAYATAHDAEEHEKALNSAIQAERIRGNDKATEPLLASAHDVVTSAKTLHATANNLHALAGGSTSELYRIERFALEDALKTVIDTLRPALARNKINPKLQGPSGVRLEGPRLIFEQVLFNLMINSIDAARARTKTRPMQIDIKWHVAAGRLVLRYFDDGPGIDPIVFSDIQQVFRIGLTSKPTGTGTGLPIARQLIGSHFSGQLMLEGRQPAMFTIDVPTAR